MLIRKLKYKICPFILLSLIIINLSFLPKLEAEPLEDELEKIKSEKETTQKKIENIKKEESAYIKEVNAVEQDLISSLDELNDLNARLADKKSKMDKITVDLAIKEEEIKKIEQELNQRLEIFNNRIKIIYKNKDKNILEVLFKSGDFIDFVSRLKMMRLLTKQDAEAISEIKQDRNILLNSKKEVLDLKKNEKEEKQEIEELLNEAELKKRGVENISYKNWRRRMVYEYEKHL